MAHLLALPDAVLLKIFRQLDGRLCDEHRPPSMIAPKRYVYRWAFGAVHVADTKKEILLAGSACRKLRQIALLALPSRVWSSTFARHTNSSEHLHCSIENATLVELGAEFNRRGPHHSRAHERFDHWPYWLDSARSIRDLHIDCADSLSADSLGLVRFPKARLDRLSLSFERCIDVSSIAALRKIFASAGTVVCESILLEPKLYNVNTDDDCVRSLIADLGDITVFGRASAGTAFLQTSTLSVDMRWPERNRYNLVARVDRVWTILAPPWPTRLHLMAGRAFACALYPPGCPQSFALRYLCIDSADTGYPVLAEFAVSGLERFCSLEHLKLVWRFCPGHVSVAPSVRRIDLKLTFRLPFRKAYSGISTWEMPGVEELELNLPWSPEEEAIDLSQCDAWQKAICLDRHFAEELEDMLNGTAYTWSLTTSYRHGMQYAVRIFLRLCCTSLPWTTLSKRHWKMTRHRTGIHILTRTAIGIMKMIERPAACL